MNTWVEPAEIWLPIEGHEGLYEVSDFGRVRSVDREVDVPLRGGGTYRRRRRGQIIKAQPGDYGHLSLRLSKDGKALGYGVHRLVLTAFIGPCPLGMQGLHEDDDPSNNRLSNLRWGTPKENQQQSHDRGRAYLAKVKMPPLRGAVTELAEELRVEGNTEMADIFLRLAKLMLPQERQ